MWRWGLYRVSVELRGIPLATILVAAVLVCSSCGVQDEQGRRGKQTETTFSPETTPSAREMPNILFILTDDQDPESLARMDSVRRLLVRQGPASRTPSPPPRCAARRASASCAASTPTTMVSWSMTTVHSYGGFRELGLQDSTVATWLDDVGYDTLYAGKLLNGYKNTSYVPPGWDEWYAFSGHPHWGSYDVNENGELKTYARTELALAPA